MCPKPGAIAGTDHFQPDLKCCTFHPTLPNYLAGAILADGGEGAARLRATIAARVGVSPWWLASPRKYRLLLTASQNAAFGKAPSLLCPYFERTSARCTIWRHREAVCATFFCKYERGAVGRASWKALQGYITHLEMSFGEDAVRALAPDAVPEGVKPGTLTREDLEDRPPGDETYAKMWGPWAGREEELYRAAHAHVGALSGDDVSRISGDRGAELLAAFSAAHDEAVAPVLRATLRKNPDMDESPADGGVTVATYSSYDPVHLTADLWAIVGLFDGASPVADVRARLRTEHDVVVPDELLLELQNRRVLT